MTSIQNSPKSSRYSTLFAHPSIPVGWGRPLLSRPRGAVDSGPAAVPAAVESVAVSAVAWSCGCAVGFVWVDGCEVHPCDPCARVRPCVPCVPCVSRLPPVSFYRVRSHNPHEFPHVSDSLWGVAWRPFGG